MAGDLQGYFRGLYYGLTTGIVDEWADAVETELVQPIKAAAPEGETDHLKRSVRKERGRGITEWIVQAGGPLTTRAGSGEDYDYALGTEFGTQHEPAHPFFWPTVRARLSRLVRRAEEILTSRLAKL